MKKIIVLFLLNAIFFSSCSSSTEEFKIMDKLLSHKYSKDCDSIDIVSLPPQFNNSFFIGYKKEKEEVSNGIMSTAHVFTWNDNNKKWMIDEEDIKWFEKHSLNKGQITYNDKWFKNSDMNVNLVNRKPFNNEADKYKEITKRIINCRELSEISLPIFNRDKNLAIVMEKNVLTDIRLYYVFFRENNQWKLIGNTNYYEE